MKQGPTWGFYLPLALSPGFLYQCHQSSNVVTCARPLQKKITKAKRIEEMVLIPVWLSGIKALPDTDLYFLDRVFYLNRDMTSFFLLALNMSFDT
jgi:hypothetical protein